MIPEIHIEDFNYSLPDERIAKYESENQEYYKVIFHAVPLNAFSNNIIKSKSYVFAQRRF